MEFEIAGHKSMNTFFLHGSDLYCSNVTNAGLACRSVIRFGVLASSRGVRDNDVGRLAGAQFRVLE
jgi:hypothetical protein